MKKSYLLLIGFAVMFLACETKKYDFIIRNAKIYDGTGAAPIMGDVAIDADTIAAIGDLSKATATAEYDAKGLALAPGFIDTHSHHDRGMFGIRDMPACVSQGITTIVVGQDGFSEFPLRYFFTAIESEPVAVNVASYSGHNTLRDSVLGKKFMRYSTPEEIEAMKKMLAQDLEDGALGLSTGLEYDPGIFSGEAEVMELAQVAARANTRYISHIRSEDRYFWKAVDEIIFIGAVTKMPVQISHTKLAMKSIWGQTDKLLAKLDSARGAGIKITSDIYPYPYWSSTMTVLFPKRDFKDRKEAEFALSELTTPEGVLIGNYSLDTSYIGKTLSEVAALRKKDAPQTLMDMIAEVNEKDADESIIATSMAEHDIAGIMKWEHTNICSDGSGVGRHPRGFGSFTKILRQYVREEKMLTLEEAIRKMTSLSAQNVGIRKRGTIQVGYYADLVLFDPETISDQATPQKPQVPSVGIDKVWVNGNEVFSQGTTSGVFPGKVIRRQQQ